MMDKDSYENPALAKLTPEKAVMFADLSGSTRLYENVGDAAAKDLVTKSLDRLAAKVDAYDGHIVKTIGDELMCVFNSAHEAVLAARSMVRSAGQAPEAAKAGGDNLLLLRAGIHYGPVIEETGDIFGDTVNVAARMVSLAKSNTVMLSDAVRTALPLALRGLVDFYDSVVVRGKARPIDVYQVITDIVDRDETQKFTRAMEFTTDLATLVLGWKDGGNDKQLEISRIYPTVTIGRSRGNDIHFHSNMASREHARIDYKHGKFFVTDFSNNGTFIELADGTRTLIRKSDYRLILSGHLYFGEEPGEEAVTRVKYDVL